MQILRRMSWVQQPMILSRTVTENRLFGTWQRLKSASPKSYSLTLKANSYPKGPTPPKRDNRAANQLIGVNRLQLPPASNTSSQPSTVLMACSNIITRQEDWRQERPTLRWDNEEFDSWSRARPQKEPILAVIRGELRQPRRHLIRENATLNRNRRLMNDFGELYMQIRCISRSMWIWWIRKRPKGSEKWDQWTQLQEAFLGDVQVLLPIWISMGSQMSSKVLWVARVMKTKQRRKTLSSLTTLSS